METPGNRQRCAYLYRNPVPELEAEFSQIRSDRHVPLWEIVDEQRTTGLEDSRGLSHPRLAPVDVFGIRQIVIRMLTILFANVEWRICENGVDHSITDFSENFNTIAGEQRPDRGRVIRTSPVLHEGRHIEVSRPVCHHRLFQGKTPNNLLRVIVFLFVCRVQDYQGAP